jgi:hypothetical protein
MGLPHPHPEGSGCFPRIIAFRREAGVLQAAEKLNLKATQGHIASGHEFTRAANAAKSTRALALGGLYPKSLCLAQEVRFLLKKPLIQQKISAMECVRISKACWPQDLRNDYYMVISG